MLNYDDIPNWILRLEKEDLNFIKKLIKASGSLKDMARDYDISYPTIRLRLNKLIEKVDMEEEESDDAYIQKIKSLAIDNKIDLETARILINDYRRVKKCLD
jgi:hypothetical protein